MRTRIILVGLIFVLASTFSFAQQPAAQGLGQVIESLSKAETSLGARLGDYHPVVEVYIQNLIADRKLGGVPVRDDYFLGQFDGTAGPSAAPLSPGRGWFRPAGLMNRPLGFNYVPSGFAATTVPDRRVLDAARYYFTFVRR